jgi:hypothetical protein
MIALPVKTRHDTLLLVIKSTEPSSHCWSFAGRFMLVRGSKFLTTGGVLNARYKAGQEVLIVCGKANTCY